MKLQETASEQKDDANVRKSTSGVGLRIEGLVSLDGFPSKSISGALRRLWSSCAIDLSRHAFLNGSTTPD